MAFAQRRSRRKPASHLRGSAERKTDDPMYTALRATSLTIASYVEGHLRADTNLGGLFNSLIGGTMVVSLNSPQEMVDNHLEGLSIWLYRVIRDSERLNDPPERLTPRQFQQPPLPMCLHYLVTPRIPVRPNSPETEQAVLGKALQVFYDHPILQGADLQDDLIGTTAQLHIRLEPMSLEEIARVWDALDASYQLSVSYEVSIVNIRSQVVETRTPVESVRPEVGIIVGAAATGS